MVVVEIDGRQWKRCECCHRYSGHHDCKFCSKSYKTPGGLRRHEVACYLNPERQCPVCQGVYSSEGCGACDEAERRQTEWAQTEADMAESVRTAEEMWQAAAQGKGE